MNTPPRLMSPSETPPLLSAVAVHQQWCALMGPLGFSDRSIWMMLLDRHGRPLPMLPRVEGLPPLPDPLIATNMVRVCRTLTDVGDDALGKVAFLLSRPGDGVITTSDRAWAQAIEHAAAEGGLPIWPVHIASDDHIQAYDLPLAA